MSINAPKVYIDMLSNEQNTVDKKFFKLFELTGIFRTIQTKIYNKNHIVFTGELNPNPENYGVYGVSEQTIIFITASENDEGKFIKINYNKANYEQNDNKILLENQDLVNSKYIKINKGDTLLWVKGDFYSLSNINITDISREGNSLNINNSDGTINAIDISCINTVEFPLKLEDGNISLEEIYLDKNNKNYIEFPSENSVSENVKNAHVQGVGNNANESYQTIIGKYSNPLSNCAFILGWGTDNNNRKNIFYIKNTGEVNSTNNIISNINGKQYKLSNIHSITDEDWVNIGYTDK